MSNDKMRQAFNEAYSPGWMGSSPSTPPREIWDRAWQAAIAAQAAQPFCEHCDYSHAVGPLCDAAKAEHPKAEPVAWYDPKNGHTIEPSLRARMIERKSLGGEFAIAAKVAEMFTVPLYLAPPAPVVPGSLEAIPGDYETPEKFAYDRAYVDGWNACRAAMLAAAAPEPPQ